ncbi:hypothetical protein POTOM_020089 [Populus tomentosa]|uniref:Uncharacterized protein n=1 Tax=Populus tomentosa TaxID=118781 RepID=A0A8X8CUS0_POPTO|nr:hypothetical protein POTOM_020089 [Populus tomentosa]
MLLGIDAGELKSGCEFPSYENRRGASYHLGHACAREHVGLAVQDAAVCLRERPILSFLTNHDNNSTPPFVYYLALREVIAISKSLVASILMISLLVLHLVEADQNMLNLML